MLCQDLGKEVDILYHFQDERVRAIQTTSEQVIDLQIAKCM